MAAALPPCPHCADHLPVYCLNQLGNEWDRWYLVSAAGVVFQDESLEGVDSIVSCVSCGTEIEDLACDDCGGEIEAGCCRDCGRAQVSIVELVSAAFDAAEAKPEQRPFYEVDFSLTLPSGVPWTGRLQLATEDEVEAFVAAAGDRLTILGVRPAVLRSVAEAVAVIDGVIAQHAG